VLTGMLRTIHRIMLIEYTAEYFQGFRDRSNSSVPVFFTGADEGIAFRPVDVKVSGFEVVNRGRIVWWRR
jgi:hypothetical protein